MGEIIVNDCVLGISIEGKYNSRNRVIALLQFVDFDKNKDFIMNIVNQYEKIQKITKKAMMDDIDCKEYIRDYFISYSGTSNNFFEDIDINLLEDFEIEKLIKDEYPLLYFYGGIEKKVKSFHADYTLYRDLDKKYSDPVVLYIHMDAKLNILGYMIEPDIVITRKKINRL